MSCSKSFTLSQAVTGENPMDAAAYASTDNLIIGVRGSRVYKCSATDGSIIGSPVDYQQLGYGPATICYDVGIGRVFAACWNTMNVDTVNAVGLRIVTRIIPASLTPDLTFDVTTEFGHFLDTIMQTGMAVMKSSGGTIYGMGGYQGTFATGALFAFQANNLGIQESHGFGGEYPSFALAVVGGNQRMYWNSVTGQRIQYWDFVAAAETDGPVDTRNRLSIEYAPTQGRLYCPEELRYIDVYDNTGTFVLQLDTMRSNFNGVNIQRNPNVTSPTYDMLFVAGGIDNYVALINPATNSVTMKSGFDNPVNFVFTPTKSFAVQAGAVGLKEVI